MAFQKSEGGGVTPDACQGGDAVLFPSETAAMVFISSAMNDNTAATRREAVDAVQSVSFMRPWAFEYTSASSDGARSTFLDKVRKSAFVIWLATEETSGPVHDEIREAVNTNRRLLVFKLFEQGATDVTERLLAEVQKHVKWCRTGDKAGRLGEAIRLALCDEVNRALSLPREDSDADDVFSEEWLLSIGRCVARWQTLQVPKDIASSMALDLKVVSPVKDLPETGVGVLTGEVGVGKSLVLERLFQRAIQEFQGDKGRPVPVFLDAHEIVRSLRETIHAIVKRLGCSRKSGVCVFIDRADEQGDSRLKALVEEARALTVAWSDSRVVIASRELPCLNGIEERLQVSGFSYEDAAALVSRIEGDETHPYLLKALPPPMREAVTRPLFAIIYGICLRRRMARLPQSEAELLNELAEQAVGKASDSIKASLALKRLAILSVQRECTSVHVGDLAEPGDLELACQTGIVVRSGKQVQFPLLVLTHWFAAQALIEGLVDIDVIARSPMEADRWRYPLSIAVSKVSHELATRLLAPIIEKQPAFASQVVRDAVLNNISEANYEIPPAIECGNRLRSTIMCWAKGIGPLARMFHPLHNRTELPSMAVGRQQRAFGFSWYEGKGHLPPVVAADIFSDEFNKRDWPSHYWSVIGAQPAWAWLRSLDLLSHDVSTAVKRQLLFVPDGPLDEELQWEWVLELMRNGGLRSEPFPLDDVEQAVARLPSGLYRKWPSPLVIDVDCLRDRITTLRAASMTEWPAPIPGRDLPQGIWVWSSYSPERLLEKTICVFENAIIAYQQLVDEWFPNFRGRLEHAVTLPARVAGVVIPMATPNDSRGPWVSWHFEPLLRGSKSEVALRLGTEPEPRDTSRGLYNKLKTARPEAAAWISAWHEQSALNIFEAKPVTRMAYEWLERDLKKAGWIK